MLIVDSHYMLRTARCTIRFSQEGAVYAAEYSQTFRLEKAAAWIGIIGVLLVTFLQRRNWLLQNRRIILGISVLTLASGAFFLMERAGITHLLPNTMITTYAVWLLVLLLGFAISINHRWKIRYGIPVLVFLLCCCVIVGMAG